MRISFTLPLAQFEYFTIDEASSRLWKTISFCLFAAVSTRNFLLLVEFSFGSLFVLMKKSRNGENEINKEKLWNDSLGGYFRSAFITDWRDFLKHEKMRFISLKKAFLITDFRALILFHASDLRNKLSKQFPRKISRVLLPQRQKILSPDIIFIDFTASRH